MLLDRLFDSINFSITMQIGSENTKTYHSISFEHLTVIDIVLY